MDVGAGIREDGIPVKPTDFEGERMIGMIVLKRVYETPQETDGYRVLVERLWPRGISKDKGRIDLWLREIAPSAELRKWYRHDPVRWEEFRRRYREELDGKADLVRMLRDKSRTGQVTFVFASRDIEHSGAFALKEYIDGVSVDTVRRAG
jgi:uncharacterized protein YeaO (DUF488 family)